MRKIEFRGRVRIPGMADEEFDGYKNGDWVFGFVTVEYQKTFICWKDYDAIGEGVGDQDRKFPVDPKTVSQFVGLEDKNGKKIFEGDIVKCQSSIMTPSISKVKGAIENSLILAYPDEEKYSVPFSWQFSAPDIAEVIGNIYDNPELWEKAVKDE